MPCTTILVGKKASYDGSTMIARNDDSGSGHFTTKKFAVVQPKDQPRHYRSVLSHVEVDLPDNPMRYTCIPNVEEGKGIWGAAGVNEANVAMTATETITSNERVLGADPLVEMKKAQGRRGRRGYQPEVPGGIGEEDLVILTLPYIHSAREGVERLGMLHETYGTYETNGIAFADVNEIWWFESVGGHHWIARRVPDDCYVTMPNQFGIDTFDLDDALGAQKEFMCSKDMREFIEKNHLDLTMSGHTFNAREAFGSHSDADHCYNTPRAWYMQRYFNRNSNRWDGPDADYTPESDNIPWCRVPEKKITVEDIKYILSSYYQGTPFDPYASHGRDDSRGAYRYIGVNRTDDLALLQLRPYMPKALQPVEWLCFGSNAFNVFCPQYTCVNKVPEYLGGTTSEVSTDSFYWTSRLIGALADAHYGKSIQHIERYQESVGAKSHEYLNRYDAAFTDDTDAESWCEKANEDIAAMVKKEAQEALNNVLFTASSGMKNQYARNDH